ncbi:DciA family protein [Streptomyces sp. Ac-502]|uniref:DciA family protein n=1 Tax=Streptomyces sp. Ac-502 TaxID=3342801 RepID=UPI0038629051
MTEPAELSGADLARQVLADYKKTTWAIPGHAPAKRKPRPVRKRASDRRDPVGLGSVLGRMEEEQGWKTGVAGGSLLEQWPALCPELAGKVAPAHFDPDTGRLDLRPASPTYAQHLRLLGRQLIARLQAKDMPVRSIRVLAPGPLPEMSTSPAAESPAPREEAPVKARADGCAGYHAAIAAHQAAADHRTDTEIQQRTRAVAEEQVRAMRAHREPESENREAFWFAADLEETAAADPEQTRQAAIRRARDQKAGRAPAIPTAFQRTA